METHPVLVRPQSRLLLTIVANSGFPKSDDVPHFFEDGKISAHVRVCRAYERRV